jgi:hypothetical protein
MFMYVHVYTNIRVYTCVCSHGHAYIHSHTYVHRYIHTFIDTYINAYIHAYVHAHIHTCTHTYIHTYTHTYTGTIASVAHRIEMRQLTDPTTGQTNPASESDMRPNTDINVDVTRAANNVVRSADVTQNFAVAQSAREGYAMAKALDDKQKDMIAKWQVRMYV